MIGSRFDLFETISQLKAGRGSQQQPESYSADDLCVLEQDIIAVAKSYHSSRKEAGIACPVCETKMFVSAQHELEEFGDEHFSLREMGCTTCGMLVTRIHHPAVGYDCRLVR